MWHIKELQDTPFVEVQLALDESQYGKGWPKGKNGETKKGFAFFVANPAEEFDYVTSKIGENPVLTAITKNQFANWQKQALIAIEVICTYQEFEGNFMSWGDRI